MLTHKNGLAFFLASCAAEREEPAQRTPSAAPRHRARRCGLSENRNAAARATVSLPKTVQEQEEIHKPTSNKQLQDINLEQNSDCTAVHNQYCTTTEARQAKDTTDEERPRPGTESVAAEALHGLWSVTGLGLVHS